MSYDQSHLRQDHFTIYNVIVQRGLRQTSEVFLGLIGIDLSFVYWVIRFHLSQVAQYRFRNSQLSMYLYVFLLHVVTDSIQIRRGNWTQFSCVVTVRKHSYVCTWRLIQTILLRTFVGINLSIHISGKLQYITVGCIFFLASSSDQRSKRQAYYYMPCTITGATCPAPASTTSCTCYAGCCYLICGSFSTNPGCFRYINAIGQWVCTCNYYWLCNNSIYQLARPSCIVNVRNPTTGAIQSASCP